MRSQSKNTPFDGWELRGGVAATIVGGRTVFVNDERRAGGRSLDAVREWSAIEQTRRDPREGARRICSSTTC